MRHVPTPKSIDGFADFYLNKVFVVGNLQNTYAWKRTDHAAVVTATVGVYETYHDDRLRKYEAYNVIPITARDTLARQILDTPIGSGVFIEGSLWSWGGAFPTGSIRVNNFSSAKEVTNHCARLTAVAFCRSKYVDWTRQGYRISLSSEATKVQERGRSISWADGGFKFLAYSTELTEAFFQQWHKDSLPMGRRKFLVEGLLRSRWYEHEGVQVCEPRVLTRTIVPIMRQQAKAEDEFERARRERTRKLQ